MPIKMEAVFSVFFYISLAIALCSPNVSTFCGNDEQIEDLEKELMTQESLYMVTTSLSTFQHMSVKFALHLKEVFEKIESSLNKDHIDYRQCSEILEKTETATTILSSTSYGFSLVAILTNLVGLAPSLLPSRLIAAITAVVLLRERLTLWKNTGCQYATTRDCNL